MSEAAARRYAEALFELAVEKGTLDQVSEGLVEVRQRLGADESAARKFLAPRTPMADKRAFADDKLLDGVHAYVANVVRLLIDRRREGSLLAFILAFFELREDAEGILHVVVESAKAMDDEAIAALTTKLNEATKKTVVPEVVVRPELIGGLRIAIGSTMIDGSLKTSMENLGARLRAAV